MTKKPYVHSNFTRKKDDDYKTIDPRCVQSLIDNILIHKDDMIMDCCAPSGSGILNTLNSLGYFGTAGLDDAFSTYNADWCVFNPPYKRPLVDQIIRKQIINLECGNVYGVAALMRNNFDFAKTRYDMFTHKFYAGQIHMMFRPWWSEEKKHQPIHNFVWHIWKNNNHIGQPVIYYWREP